MFAVKVGDEVGFGRYGRHSWLSTGFAKVTKINGHGHITLDTGKVFDKHGNERGTSYGLSLTEAESLSNSIARETARRDQNHRVRALQQKVNDLFGYSGNAHVSPEVKAELLALVEAL